MNIEFYPSNVAAQLSIPAPKPASNYIPKWYSDNERFVGGQPDIKNNRVINNTVKACTPYSDALSAGYIQETWCDIYFELSKDKESIRYQIPRGPSPIAMRKDMYVKVDGFYNVEFTWQLNWTPKVPKGYSVLVTHPLNRIDLPFSTGTGIIDADEFYHSLPGSIPFYIKKGFSGIIPVGTPMYQIIPIKRDEWTSRAMEFDEDQFVARNSIIRKAFIGSYKRFFHVKKSWK